MTVVHLILSVKAVGSGDLLSCNVDSEGEPGNRARQDGPSRGPVGVYKLGGALGPDAGARAVSATPRAWGKPDKAAEWRKKLEAKKHLGYSDQGPLPLR